MRKAIMLIVAALIAAACKPAPKQQGPAGGTWFADATGAVELQFPEDVRYAEDHEWVRTEGDEAVIGISDYAQDQLGDIVFVELPQAGDRFDKGAEFGTVESVKAVSELYMPIGGEVVAVNAALEDAPEKVNVSPYADGWMLRVRPGDLSEAEQLMDKNAYLNVLKSQA